MQLSEITHRSVRVLAAFVHDGVIRRGEASRLARAGLALMAVGCSPNSPLVASVLAPYLLSLQRRDGGWTDVDETAWCAGFLASCGQPYLTELAAAQAWLRSQRLPTGGWGRTSRDCCRLPTLGLLSALVPNLVDSASVQVATQEWESDLGGEAPLTYKAAFFLMTQPSQDRLTCSSLVWRTIRFLEAQQEDDGGFGPWRNHPLGSDPWSTGAVLWGLARFGPQVRPGFFGATADWLAQRQLPDGNWPYHYLDDGTSMALIGLTSILPLLGD